MILTVLGIMTPVMLESPQFSNALSPMPLTGSPLIVLGIVTAPPGPVYPVMVIVPELVL